MKLNLLIGTLLLFVVGKGLLSLLVKKVSLSESTIIKKKYYGWIPISAVFFLMLFAPRIVGATFFSFILVWGLIQISIVINRLRNFDAIGIFILLLLYGSSLAFYAYANVPLWLFIFVIFGCAFADITAYSFAKLSLNTHRLPASINKEKTLEGILGEMTGPFLALIFLWLCGITEVVTIQGIIIAVAIGIGATAGDLLNSVAKRRFMIKDWGNFLGHGGVLDRFSSIFMALTLVAILWTQFGYLL